MTVLSLNVLSPVDFGITHGWSLLASVTTLEAPRWWFSVCHSHSFASPTKKSFAFELVSVLLTYLSALVYLCVHFFPMTYILLQLLFLLIFRLSQIWLVDILSHSTCSQHLCIRELLRSKFPLSLTSP